MAAYVIAIREPGADMDAISAYTRAARVAAKDFPLRVLVAHGEHEVMEGAPADSVVVLEFPTVEAAKTWYHSAQYQAAKRLRDAGARFQFILVQGV